jgi:sulfide:quinone oxidoreductase
MKPEKILIVGGGTAGITVAARLKRVLPRSEIQVIEPSEWHYYQPLWTLVGAGVTRPETTRRPTSRVMPKGVQWIKDRVMRLDPELKKVELEQGGDLTWDWLIVAPGISMHWERIGGLKATLGMNGVCSNYDYRLAGKTWEYLQGLEQGNAVFTMPETAIKCGGAPQKIMYLVEDYLRRNGRRDRCRVIFVTPGSKIFGVEKYRKTLDAIVKKRGIEVLFGQRLVAVDGPNRLAVLEGPQGDRTELDFSMLHVVPPMSAPDFVSTSPLADEGGWLKVDARTLQNPDFPNVFALGDAAGVPTGRTGAAIRKQAPVLVKNLLSAMGGQPLEAKYNGYTSCPVVTGYGRLMLAEFGYDDQILETFPFDQSRERYSMWLLKRWVLPQLYWHGMLKGLA